MNRVIVWIAVLVVGLANLSFAETLKIGAGAAPLENIFKKVADPFEKKTGIKLEMVATTPELAFIDMDKGKLDAACGGLTFADWMQSLEKGKYPVKDQSIFKNRVIGKDIIKVILNKDLNVSNLTKDQLKGIFTGTITNWKAVGGPDKPIVVVFAASIPGTNGVFQKQVLDGQDYLKNVAAATDANDIKKQVASKSGAIGLSVLALVDNTVGAPNTPEVGRPITFITKGEPSPAMIKLLDFIRTDGQQYIKK